MRDGSRVEFPYRVMSSEAMREAAQLEAVRVKALLEQVARIVLSIGEGLGHVQFEMPPQLFQAWLYSEFRWTLKIGDAYITAACEFAGGRDGACRPDAAIDLATAVAPQALVARELSKARNLLESYRSILRGDATCASLMRGARRLARHPLNAGRRRRRVKRASRRRAEESERAIDETEDESDE